MKSFIYKIRFINTVRQSSLLGANKPLYLSRVHRHSNHEVRTVVCKVLWIGKTPVRHARSTETASILHA